MEERSAIVNGLTVDEKTGALRIGRGATGWFTVTLSDIEAGAIDVDSDIVLFVVTSEKKEGHLTFSRVNSVIVDAADRSGNTCVLRKVFSIVESEETGSYEVNINLTNAETRALAVGEYRWNGVLITDPSYDTAGNIVIGDTDCVVPFYVDGERPKLTVEEVGVIV